MSDNSSANITTTKGSCLCGSVEYQFNGEARGFQYCHCSRCQKVTGSAHGAIMFVKPDQFEWLKGEDNVGRFELPEAQFYANCFCKTCGSSLPWEIQGGGNVAIHAGTLDQDPGIKPRRNIHWASKACWYTPSSELECFSDKPVRK